MPAGIGSAKPPTRAEEDDFLIAVDTNILVYAHREESEWHGEASACLRALAEGRSPWSVPWPCFHEFLSVATHPRIFDPPTPLGQALTQVESWLEAPSLVPIGEGADHWTTLRRIAEAGRIKGPRVHDARIAAICLAHGVRELWSVDRDFGRFPELVVRNPFSR